MNKRVTKEYPTLELECYHCGEIKQIPQKHKHKTSVCSDCERARQRKYARVEAEREGRRAGVMGRLPYPLGEYKYYQQKFYELRSKMGKISNREEWIEQIKINLQKTEANEELMAWINSHKDDDKPKRQKRIEKDYPDTRNMTWDEYQRGLGDDDVDS